ncbi:MAG: GyrI-like domain-containing protein [Croceivirga sp.]
MKIKLILLVMGIILGVSKEVVEEKVDDFMIIGVSVETTNQDGQAAQDMSGLWQKFFTEGVSNRIANKTSEDVFVLYTDYEKDYKGRYTAIIGHKVHSVDEVPEGLMGWTFQGGNYLKLTAKGEVPGSVVNVWNEVWSKDEALHRRYTVDYEVYGPDSQKGPNSEVNVFIAVD